MIDHKFVQANGIKLHYACVGQGKPMLFLHGFPEFWYAWKEQLKEFGKDHLACALDMRGYNLSEKPSNVDDYNVDILVADIKAVFDHLFEQSPGFKRAILVAHDWGGAVAWRFAKRYPDYLEKLVIINAPHPEMFARELMTNPAQQKASSYMITFCNPEIESTLLANNCQALQQVIFGKCAKREAFALEDKRAYLEAWNQPGALTGGLNYYRAAQLDAVVAAAAANDGNPKPAAQGVPAQDRAMVRAAMNKDAANQAVQMNVPTLVIWGEKDHAILIGNLEGIEDYVPNVCVQRIPDGTHWVIHEEPVLVNQYIREFVS
jgi:pimeloyl-ACP methyl ester carboxylesterase